ncbi:MAG: glycosyltransferase family 4 protein [Pseudanabaenaceae cyanobacterium]
MQHLRILIISNLFPPQVVGGYERAIADYARRLHERGHEILVLTADVRDLPTAYDDSKSDPKPFPVRRCLQLFGEYVDGGIAFLHPEVAASVGMHNYTVLSDQIPGFAPDVCLCGCLDFLGVGIPKQLLGAGVPVAHFVMNNVTGYPFSLSPREEFYQYITVSDWIKSTLSDGGYPTHSAITIYPGADTEFFTPSRPRELLTDKLSILYAGLVMPHKGTDVLIDALSLLHQEGIDFTATIAGGSLNTNYVAQLKSFVQEQGMTDQVKFTGLLGKAALRDLYRTHNVYVLPSRFDEPFSIGLIEAMAAGLTCIASHVGGSPEAITDQENGLIFTSENALELADGLASLPLQPELWQTMALAGQQKAVTQFSRQRTIEQIEAVLWNLYQRKKLATA